MLTSSRAISGWTRGPEELKGGEGAIRGRFLAKKWMDGGRKEQKKVELNK